MELLERRAPVRDHFAELYLDVLEAETQLRRRLSRLESTFERQLEVARYESYVEAQQLRESTLKLAGENERLRRRLSEAGLAK